MKKLFRISLLGLGVLLLISASLLYWLVQHEEDVARTSSLSVVAEFQSFIDLQTEEEESAKTMAIDGSYYIGVLSMPQLDISLPVAAAYSYEQLDKTPCVYTGSVKMNNIIIAAHNYKAHFGTIDQLAYGDVISFVDVSGVEHSYMLTKEETIGEDDVVALHDGDWDMTLFTCVYGNNNKRLLLRFDEIS